MTQTKFPWTGISLGFMLVLFGIGLIGLYGQTKSTEQPVTKTRGAETRVLDPSWLFTRTITTEDGHKVFVVFSSSGTAAVLLPEIKP